MGFETLPQAIVSPQSELTAAETAFTGEQLTDESALTIVVNDTNAAVSFTQSKGLVTDWDLSDDLYRAYVQSRNWPGTEVPRANLSMPLILEVIEKLMPELYLAFFSDDQPFVLEAKGKTTPEAARARAKVLAWALKQADFKEEMRRTLKSCLLYGFTVGKYGWKTETKKKYVYSRKAQPTTVTPDLSAVAINTVESDEVVRTPKILEINRPTFENVELRNVLIDPKLREQDCRKGRFLIFQKFITADDLVDLAKCDEYKNIPTKEELRVILASKSEPTVDSLQGQKSQTWQDLQAEPEVSTSGTTATADPLMQPLELLEYWTDDRVITVLQRVIVIRNEEHEFQTKPFVSTAFIDVLGAAYGFGVAKLLCGEQRFETGVVNTWIDQLALTLNPAWQEAKGIGAGTQQIKVSPGKVITGAGELKPLTQQSVTGEALGAISSSENRANRRVGSNGGSDIPTQALRTAQGVNAFQNDITNRLQYFIDIFSNLVFIPTLNAFIEMCNDHLKPSQINEILSDEDGKEYAGDVMEVYNAQTNVDVLATTKLAARKASAQLVPMMIQMVSAAPVQSSFVIQGKKFNYAEMLTEALTLAGWDVDALIQDMTPDDFKRAQAMNPAMAKAAGDSQLQEQKHQDDLETVQETATGRAGVSVVKHILNESKDAKALTGLVEQMAQPQSQA